MASRHSIVLSVWLTHVGSTDIGSGYLVVKRYLGFGFDISFIALVIGRRTVGSGGCTDACDSLCNDDSIEVCWGDWSTDGEDDVGVFGMFVVRRGADSEDIEFWGAMVGVFVGGICVSSCSKINGWRDMGEGGRECVVEVVGLEAYKFELKGKIDSWKTTCLERYNF